MFCLNPMVTTAANISVKTVFHKLALFIILSPFLCKRRTNSEQPYEGLASRSLQTEICWFLFQWGERQLPEQTARVVSSEWKKVCQEWKAECPGPSLDLFCTPFRVFSPVGCGGADSLGCYKAVMGRWVRTEDLWPSVWHRSFMVLLISCC